MSFHKYLNNSGYPTFQNHLPDAVGYRDDVPDRQFQQSNSSFVKPEFRASEPEKRVVCSNCESHLGYMYEDGPYPFYKRFQVNSGSLTFKEKPWFTPPNPIQNKKVKHQQYLIKRGEWAKAEHDLVKEHEEYFGFEPRDYRKMKEEQKERKRGGFGAQAVIQERKVGGDELEFEEISEEDQKQK